MSAYICDNKTISCIAEGFNIYDTPYTAKDYKRPTGWLIDVNDIRNGIGQSLLNQNYASVNARYGEDTKTPRFKYEDILCTPNNLIGCIRCYEYQACETDGYEESEVHKSLLRLKLDVLNRLVGETTWGYPEEEE